MTLSPHSLLVDGCPVHQWNAFGFSMSSFCHAQHSSPKHWPSTATVNDNGAAGKSSSPTIREETHRGIRLDWVSAFLRKKSYSLAAVLSNNEIIILNLCHELLYCAYVPRPTVYQLTPNRNWIRPHRADWDIVAHNLEITGIFFEQNRPGLTER